jgi:hypothetical protein
MEVCNHRGDVDGALRALERLDEAAREGRGLALDLVRVDAYNLANVTVQNMLPASEEEVERVCADLERYGALLLDLAARLERAATSLAVADVGGDPDIGRLLGTVARTFGFLERWDEADALLLRARKHFVAERDTRFNRIVRARLAVASHRADRLAEELDALLSTPKLLTADAWTARVREDPAERFLLDVLLRAQAAGVPVPGLDPGSWRQALCERELFTALSEGPGTHPTELIARHAWEVVRHDPPAASRWLDLSLRVARAGGPTLRRFALFTEALARGEAPRGPAGSVFNPTFEYR